MKEYTHKELIVARAMCDNSLLFFTQFFFKLLRGQKFIVNWHHKEITEDVEAINNYKYEFANFNLPPRHTKTEIIAINNMARGIGMNPQANYLYITASDELRSEVSVRIRDIITHPIYKKMYDVEVKKDMNTKNLWKTTAGGGFKTATIFGQITGFGAGQLIEHNEDLEDYIREFEGCIILDDINKVNDTLANNANNEKANNTIFTTVLSRKNSNDTPMINIQQRTGVNDVTNMLLEFYSGKNILNKSYPVLIDGKPLWPKMMDMDRIEQIRTNHKTAHVFDAQYMQNPCDDKSVLFPKSKLNFYKTVELKDTYAVNLGATDTADEGTDYLCSINVAVIDSKVYVTDVIFTTEDTDVTIPLMAEFFKKNNQTQHLFESNNGGKYIAKSVRDKHRALGGFTLIKWRHTAQNKRSKIISYSETIRQFFYFREDYEVNSHYDVFMKFLVKYAKDGSFKFDDAPDCLSMIADMVMSLRLIIV